MRIIILLLVFAGSGCSIQHQDSARQNDVNRLFVKAKDYFNQNSDTIRDCMVRIMKIADTNDNQQKSETYYVRGIHSLSSGNMEEAINLLTISKNAALLIPSDTLAGYAFLAMGSSQLYSGDAAKSIDYYLSGKIFFERSGSNEQIEKAYSSLALAYYINFDNTEAEKYIAKINSISAGTTRAFLIGMHVQSNILSDNDLPDSALKIDRLAVAIAEKNNINGLTTAFYDNMATCFILSDEKDSSRYYYNKCLAIDSAGKQTQKMADTYAKLVYLAGTESDENKVLNTASRALKFCDSTNFVRGKYNVYLGMEKFYESRKDYSKALSFKDSLISTKDQLINSTSKEKIDELNIRYSTLEKEGLISKQENRLKLNRLFLAFLGAATILLILLFYYYSRNSTAQKKTAVEKAVRIEKDKQVDSVFESEQKERIRIARDLHDSVGQKLSVLKMFLVSENPDRAKINTILDDTISEVRSISHNLIPEALNFGLRSAVGSTINQMQNNFPMEIIYQQEEGCELLQIDLLKSLHIYRIFQEILSNTIKHSNADKIVVNFNKESTGLIITVTDNGVGFNDKDTLSAKGIGWKNILYRTGYLKADLDVTSRPGSGTIVRLQIPLE